MQIFWHSGHQYLLKGRLSLDMYLKVMLHINQIYSATALNQDNFENELH